MCKQQLDNLKAVNPKKFKLYHTLTRHDPSKHGEWNGLIGRVNYQMLEDCGLPPPADNILILTCGPQGLHETINQICEENGYTKGE